MAQTIYCEVPGGPHPADVMIGYLSTGEQERLCFLHLLDWARNYVEAALDAEIQATDNEAVARIAAVDAPPQSRGWGVEAPGDELTQVLPEPPSFPTPPESSDADAAAPEPPIRRASGRGKSEVAPMAADEASDDPGGSQAPT